MKPLAYKIIVIGAALFLGLVAQGQSLRIQSKPTNSLLENFQALRKTNNPALATNALKSAKFLPGKTGTVTISKTGIQPVLMPSALPPVAPNSPLTTTPTNLPLPSLGANPNPPTNAVTAPTAAPALAVTNSIPSTNVAPTEAKEPDGSSGILAQLKAQEQALRVQEKQPTVGEQAQVVSLGTNELGDKLKDLEFTGEYVERFVRIPEGNAGKAKFIRFLVPVFRHR